MEQLLISYYFYILLFEFTSFFIVLFSCRNWVFKIFKKISKRTWLILALVFLLGLALRINGPHVYETYFDSYEYASSTQSMARNREFYTCTLKVENACYQKNLPAHPPSSNFLYSFIMIFIGTTENDFFNSSVIVGSISIVLFFFVAFMLFKQENIALWSAFAFSLIPIHIKLSSTGMLEIGEIFYFLLAFLSILLLKEKPNRKTFLLVIFSTVLLIQSRAEAVLFLFLVPFSIFLFRKEIFKKFSLKKLFYNKFDVSNIDVIFILLVVLLFLPDIYYVTNVTHRYSSFGIERGIKGFSIENLFKNIRPDLSFYFDSRYHPISYSILAIVGVYYVLRENLKKEYVFLFAWFLSFSLFFLLYNYGDYEYSESQHFSLISYPPLVFFAVIGIEMIIKYLKRCRIFLIFIFVLLILSNAYFFDKTYIHAYAYAYGPAKPTTYEFINEYYFVKSFQKTLPTNSFIITINPSIIFANTNYSGSEAWIFLEEKDMILNVAPVEKHNYYFFENYWCNFLSTNKNYICDELKMNYDLQLVNESSDGLDKLYLIKFKKGMI